MRWTGYVLASHLFMKSFGLEWNKMKKMRKIAGRMIHKMAVFSETLWVARKSAYVVMRSETLRPMGDSEES